MTSFEILKSLAFQVEKLFEILQNFKLFRKNNKLKFIL